MYTQESYYDIIAPAHTFTIIYTDSMSDRHCGIATISTTLCTNSVCSYTFELSSLCSQLGAINLTVFATSKFGNGSLSEPITISKLIGV